MRCGAGTLVKMSEQELVDCSQKCVRARGCVSSRIHVVCACVRACLPMCVRAFLHVFLFLSLPLPAFLLSVRVCARFARPRVRQSKQE
jgi:hypothetical protein